MYENLTNASSTNNSPKPFSVRLAAMPVNEKAAYVESVCAALIDSRFGRRLTPFIINLRELPEDEEAVFCEMTEAGLVPSYIILPDSEIARRYAADIVRQELAQAEAANVSVRAQARPPSNLGRGSPKYLWDASRVCSPHLSVART